MDPLLYFHPQELCIPGLKKDYRLLQVSDAHLILYDEEETPARAAYAAPRIPMFSKDGISSNQRFECLLTYIHEHAAELDAVVFTGDIVDFPSKPALRYLKEKLDALPVPYLYTLGNHDWSYFDNYHTPHSRVAERPLFSAFCGGNTYLQKLRLGELTLIGVDNTQDFYEDGVPEALDEALKGEERVLLLQHIPFYADTLHDITAAVWRRDITVGGKGICHNDNWRLVQERITRPDSPVRALITGHLHFTHYDLVNDRLPQFVAGQTALGDIHIFHIHG